MRWMLAWLLLISLIGCASQTPGPQAGGWRLPNCNIAVFGRYPNLNCTTGGMSIPVGR
jgi:hypothetical protein